MINLFSLKYGKEVEKTEDLIYDSLTHGEVVFQMDKERKKFRFNDGKGTEWLYVPGILHINFQELKAGYVYCRSDGTSLVRTTTPEEVTQKAKEYFLNYAIQEEKPENTNSQQYKGFNLN